MKILQKRRRDNCVNVMDSGMLMLYIWVGEGVRDQAFEQLWHLVVKRRMTVH